MPRHTSGQGRPAKLVARLGEKNQVCGRDLFLGAIRRGGLAALRPRRGGGTLVAFPGRGRRRRQQKGYRSLERSMREGRAGVPWSLRCDRGVLASCSALPRRRYVGARSEASWLAAIITRFSGPSLTDIRFSSSDEPKRCRRRCRFLCEFAFASWTFRRGAFPVHQGLGRPSGCIAPAYAVGAASARLGVLGRVCRPHTGEGQNVEEVQALRSLVRVPVGLVDTYRHSGSGLREVAPRSGNRLGGDRRLCGGSGVARLLLLHAGTHISVT
mmetsp:Transcript_101487/g.254404  ORF Transcript_101487/g.254404 Transcript_101487/m.254404 type:complete len:270 (+) Transcript_101487:975-1784(+)